MCYKEKLAVRWRDDVWNNNFFKNMLLKTMKNLDMQNILLCEFVRKKGFEIVIFEECGAE